MTNREEELTHELEFMYKKYEELCHSYKRLAKEKSVVKHNEVNDMSHMSFQQKENM
jgi:hypothetical protein